MVTKLFTITIIFAFLTGLLTMSVMKEYPVVKSMVQLQMVSDFSKTTKCSPMGFCTFVGL